MSGLADFGYRREVTARRGPVPPTIDNPIIERPLFALSRDAFLLKLPNGLSYHYARGHGVQIEAPDTIGDDEIALFQDGSVYGAIAWINGLVPLHASAIVHNGKAYAFAADSGEGKSTLVAALAGEGFMLLSDDVLVLDIDAANTVRAFPGHKRLKLWADALALTGLSGGTQVSPELDKYYVRHDHAVAPVPLAALFLLKAHTEDAPRIAPVTGAERFARMRAAFYRPFYANALLTPARQFEIASRLASQVALYGFDRPFDKAKFAQGVAHIAAFIRAQDV